MKPPEACPNCGADIPPDARACPECGSDEKTGWADEAQSSGLALPGEKFDYDDFVKREFEEQSPRPKGISWFWWIIAIALLALFLRLFF